jgi:hypothetical protein
MLILTTEASTSSGTCVQVGGDEEDQIFDILDNMNRIDKVNGHDEGEDKCGDGQEIAAKGRGKCKGKLI